MDYHLPVVSDDGDLSWSDSMGSDDGHSMIMPDSPGEWMDQLPPASLSMPHTAPVDIPHPRTGQLSPISNGLGSSHGDYHADASGPSQPSMMAHSASLSSTNSWNMDFADSDDMAGLNAAGADGDYRWEQGSDDVMTVPKLEPLDDDEVRLENLEEAPTMLTGEAGGGTENTPLKVKKPRGRPRKHPLTPLMAANKITKGRSKTGCLTCRKRKKKCDEAKPRCKS